MTTPTAKTPQTVVELVQTIDTIAYAISTLAYKDSRRKVDLLHRTKVFRKAAKVRVSWINEIKDMTLQQLFDLAATLPEGDTHRAGP